MKKFIPFLLFSLLVSVTAWSQATISVNPSPFVLTGHRDSNDVSIHLEVTNTSNIDAFVLWSRVIESAPAGWLSWICDKNLCYIPTANACSPTKPNVLAPGEKMDFQIHVNPSAVEGVTGYCITFMDYEDPNIILAETCGEVIISSSVSTQNTSQSSSLTVYPNPTQDYFQVSETPGLKYIQLYNIVGNKMKSFDALPQKQYYVGDLSDGIYLVRLVSGSGKIIKTIRLSKR